MSEWSQQQSPSHVGAALSDLILHPAQTFIYSWNWKSALMSAMLRSPFFFVATLRRGVEAISIAVVLEAVYSAAMSGCYGAFVQKLRRARPLWASGLLILLIMPAFLWWLDYLLHYYTRMPNLKGGMAAIGVWSLLSSLFNWFLMSHGAMLVGKHSRSFAADLKRLPLLLISFISWIPRHCYRYLRSTDVHMQA